MILTEKSFLVLEKRRVMTSGTEKKGLTGGLKKCRQTGNISMESTP